MDRSQSSSGTTWGFGNDVVEERTEYCTNRRLTGRYPGSTARICAEFALGTELGKHIDAELIALSDQDRVRAEAFSAEVIVESAHDQVMDAREEHC